jgi:hypothetical protein
LLLVVLVAVCFLVYCPEADAGPGGQFVKQALSSKFGKVGGLIVGGLLLIAVVLLLPLMLYIKYKESAGIRRTKKDLAVLADKYSWFEWLAIRDRVNQAVRKIGQVWDSGDLSSVASFMTVEYFVSQQQLLRRWLDEGKQVVYKLEKVCGIEPLAVRVENADSLSWIRVLVKVDCVDYVRDRHTFEVIKGDVGKTNGFESVWCFAYSGQQWLLNSIEEGSTSLAWASEKNHVSTTYLEALARQRQPDREPAPISSHAGSSRTSSSQTGSSRTRDNSQAAAPDSETNQPAAQPKQPLVRKPADDQDQ